MQHLLTGNWPKLTILGLPKIALNEGIVQQLSHNSGLQAGVNMLDSHDALLIAKERWPRLRVLHIA